MLNDDDMLVGFLDEAREHLSTIEPDLLALETDPGEMNIINRLFRSVHSIKGGAGFFGLEKMSSLSHAMENLMSKARTEKLVVERKHIDLLLIGLDRLNMMIDDVQHSNELDISDEIAQLEALTSDEELTPKAKPAEPPPSATPDSNLGQSKTKASIESQVDSHLKVSAEELESVKKEGLEIYAAVVYLNRDIMNQGKTPFQFISELEEFGRFLDSYLDVESASLLEECLDDDLSFVFVFAAKVKKESIATKLRLDGSQIMLYSEVLERIQEAATEKNEEQPAEKQTQPEDQENLASSPEKDQEEAQAPQENAEEPPKEEKEALPPSKPMPPALQSSEVAKSSSVKNVKTEESIRVGVSKLNKLVDLAGELVLVRNQLLQASEKEAKMIPGLFGILQGLNIVTTELQEEILNTRMQPISTVFGKFPRLIRELGTKMGKDIVLVTEGNEVELDKTVLEALSDPLTHIIRNTADHGIESPSDRKARGKSTTGELLLKAYHESGQVIILVKDDGKGIDPDKIAAKAHEKGLITEEDFYTLSEREKINLVFHPGFSMAEKVSSVSGRGVGMDVVRSNIEQIGGSVELSSVVGKGTNIKMTLPLTMAIVSCLIVQSGNDRFAIPQVNLDELVMLKPDDYESMLGYVQEREVLKLRGDLLPLISLSSGLGLDDKNGLHYKKVMEMIRRKEAGQGKSSANAISINTNEPSEKGSGNEAMRILIISVGINKVGIIVDSIVGSEEIVVKPMPEYLKHLIFFSGATILGDGTVAMILDTLGFVQKNQLSFTERKAETYVQDEERRQMAEQQSLLIFDNNTDEQFAITIPLIQRIDEIKLEEIQHIGDKEYIEYRGSQMRILHLSDYLPIQKPTYDSEYVNIIIPKETRIPVGILIYRVIDTKTLFINVSEGSIHGEGILGSTLIDKKITLLLDLYRILEEGEPESIQKIAFKQSDLETKKILLVEDTPLFLTIVKEYLSSVGFQVKTAMNGVEGLEAMEQEEFDLILSDIEMPEMDGWGLIQSIRAKDKWKDMPVIALTSISDEDLIETGLKSGFNEWLVKLDKEKILECMNRYLAS